MIQFATVTKHIEGTTLGDSLKLESKLVKFILGNIDLTNEELEEYTRHTAYRFVYSYINGIITEEEVQQTYDAALQAGELYNNEAIADNDNMERLRITNQIAIDSLRLANNIVIENEGLMLIRE